MLAPAAMTICCAGSDKAVAAPSRTLLVRLTVCEEPLSLRTVNRTVSWLDRTEGITNTSAMETGGTLTTLTGCQMPYSS